MITYKSVVKTMAAHNGLTASFDPIPIPGKDGNGFHITLTPMLREKDCSENFLAGILAHAAEITAILNPTARFLQAARRVRRAGVRLLVGKEPALLRVQEGRPARDRGPFAGFPRRIRTSPMRR